MDLPQIGGLTKACIRPGGLVSLISDDQPYSGVERGSGRSLAIAELPLMYLLKFGICERFHQATTRAPLADPQDPRIAKARPGYRKPDQRAYDQWTSFRREVAAE